MNIPTKILVEFLPHSLVNPTVAMAWLEALAEWHAKVSEAWLLVALATASAAREEAMEEHCAGLLQMVLAGGKNMGNAGRMWGNDGKHGENSG
jgi:hypothetical protein